MSESEGPIGPPQSKASILSGPFSAPRAERGFPTAPAVIAGVAVLILLAVLVMLGRRPKAAPSDPLPLAAYAPNLTLSGIEMSESTSLSGGKSTYIDGRVTNHGQSTVTGIGVQVLFRNDEAMPPQVETLPLALIRTRQPYIDTQPVSADPLPPGAEREFRLTFENIAANWNQQPPEIHITAVHTR